VNLTIAKASTEEELDRLYGEVSARLKHRLPLAIEVHALTIEEEGADGNWKVSSTIRLRG
jgi:hypothetical protein